MQETEILRQETRVSNTNNKSTSNTIIPFDHIGFSSLQNEQGFASYFFHDEKIHVMNFMTFLTFSLSLKCFPTGLEVCCSRGLADDLCSPHRTLAFVVVKPTYSSIQPFLA